MFLKNDDDDDDDDDDGDDEGLGHFRYKGVDNIST